MASRASSNVGCQPQELLVELVAVVEVVAALVAGGEGQLVDRVVAGEAELGLLPSG
jgi:hypothetical protein